jgi:hypothetical protein
LDSYPERFWDGGSIPPHATEESSSEDGLLLFYEHRQVTLSAFLRQLVFLLIGIGTIAFFHFGI